ncbi:beta-1,3-N-acetylglucosaminyltransferase radical fringe-like [Arapaima gigas]
MHFSRIGISKLCFLLSLAFCAFLLLLIPNLQTSRWRSKLPQPRSRTLGRGAGVSGQKQDRAVVRQLPHRGPGTGNTTGVLDRGTWGVRRSAAPHSSLSAGGAVTRVKHNTPPPGDTGVPRAVQLGARPREQLELTDIFIAVKTTKKYHKSRLELLFQTWISQAKEQDPKASREEVLGNVSTEGPCVAKMSEGSYFPKNLENV